MEGQIDFTELTTDDLKKHLCAVDNTLENMAKTSAGWTTYYSDLENRFQKTFSGFKKTKICEVCQKQKFNKTCLD